MSYHRVPRCSLSLQHDTHARTHTGMRNGVSAICRTVEVLRLQSADAAVGSRLICGKLGSVCNHDFFGKSLNSSKFKEKHAWL